MCTSRHDLVGINIKSKPILDKHAVVTPGFIFLISLHILQMNKMTDFGVLIHVGPIVTKLL